MHVCFITSFLCFFTCGLSIAEKPGVVSQPETSESRLEYSKAYRPASKADLLGMWKQVEIRGIGDFDLSDSWYSGLQFWEFFEDNLFRVIVFETGVPSPEDLFKIQRHGPKRSSYEFLNNNGQVKIRYANGSRYQVIVTRYTEDFLPGELVSETISEADLDKLPKKGDITLTYVDLGTNRPLFFRLLRYQGEAVEPLPEVQNPPEPVPMPPRVEDDPKLREILKEQELRTGRKFGQ